MRCLTLNIRSVVHKTVGGWLWFWGVLVFLGRFWAFAGDGVIIIIIGLRIRIRILLFAKIRTEFFCFSVLSESFLANRS